MKVSLLFAFIFYCTCASSQVTSSPNSEPPSLYAAQDLLTGNILSNTTIMVKGQPVKTNINLNEFFFNKKWLNGRIQLLSGQVYENVKVRIDLLNHTLHFLARDTDFVLQPPVLEVKITDTINKETVRFVHANNLKREYFHIQDGWYQSLAEGKLSLYKKIEKKLESSRDYGSASTNYKVITIEKYLLLYNGAFHVINKWKDVEKIFPGDKIMSEIIDFNKKENKKFEVGLQGVCREYNSKSD